MAKYLINIWWRYNWRNNTNYSLIQIIKALKMQIFWVVINAMYSKHANV